MEHPLYFFFDVETTGPGPLDDHIIEMAATAANPDGVIQENTFYSLVFTDRQISPAVSGHVHGLQNWHLEGEESFPAVFTKFFNWMVKTTRKLARAERRKYYPVLVVHDGNVVDFRVLFSECQRHKIDPTRLEEWKVRFSDSLEYLREVKKIEKSTLDQFGLQDLYVQLCPEHEYKGHRASLNAEYLKILFTESPLNKHLSSMTQYTYKEQQKKYRTALNVKRMEQAYCITPTQAKRLVACGFSKVKLKRLYNKAPQDFDGVVKRRGVHSKAVRDKLYSYYSLTV